MKTEYEMFEEFFRTMGVEYSIFKWDIVETNCISVTQAHFLFDRNGNFMGVQPDEHGNFQEKIK